MSVPQTFVDELEEIWSRPLVYKIERPSEFSGSIFNAAQAQFEALNPHIDFEIKIPKPPEGKP